VINIYYELLASEDGYEPDQTRLIFQTDSEDFLAIGLDLAKTESLLEKITSPARDTDYSGVEVWYCDSGWVADDRREGVWFHDAERAYDDYKTDYSVKRPRAAQDPSWEWPRIACTYVQDLWISISEITVRHR